MEHQKRLIESVKANLSFALQMRADETFFVRLYSTLINSVLDIITVHSLDSKYLFITPNSLKHFGYTQEEMFGKTPFDFIVPEDISSVYQVYQQLLKNEALSLTICFRHLTKSGEIRVLESLATVINNDSNEPTGFLISSRDITEVWNKDQIIKDSEERYRNLVENTDTLITTFDRELNYCFANSNAANFWGLTPTDMVGKNWCHFSPNPETYELFAKHIRHVFATKEKVMLYNFKSNIEPNNPRWFSMNISPLMGANNQVNQVMISATETTSSVLYKERIQEQTLELKEIAFIQSHMVRSPLANIQGLLTLIEDTCADKETNKEQLDMLKLVMQEAQKLDRLLIDIVQKSYRLRHK